MTHIFKVLRDSTIHNTHNDALTALKAKSNTIGDGQLCIASYKDASNEIKSILSIVRNTGGDKGYTIFDIEDLSTGGISITNIGDGFEIDGSGKIQLKLGNGLEFDSAGKLKLKLDTNSESYLTLSQDGLKLSGIDTIKQDLDNKISTLTTSDTDVKNRLQLLESGATKDVIAVSAASVSAGNVELTGTAALSSTITVSGTNQYFNGKQNAIETSKLSLLQGATNVPLTNGKATVTLPTAANATVAYTAKMASSTTANTPSVSFRMVTRIYARYDSTQPTNINSFINSAAGNSGAASSTVASGVVTSATNQILTIPVNGTGDKIVYFAVPSYINVAGGSLPDSLDASIAITDTGSTLTKQLGGGTQTWKIYKTSSTFPSSQTVRIKLR